MSTTYVLDKFIHSGSHILDVGAGTGVYSLYYAEKGCSVIPVEVIPKYIEILRSKLQLKPELDIQPHLDDIRDLTFPSTADFDVVLFMGPIYHIPKQDARHCLDKCLRVLKKDGILAVSYCNTYEGYERDQYADIVVFYSPADIEQLLSEFDLAPICHVPTDGEVFGELNELAQGQQKELGEFHAWLDNNQHVLYDPLWTSTSLHALYVARKI